MDDYDKINQRIGEFVVSFQWLENRFRETGWLIQDPDRKEWPPTSLRRETNHDLLAKVEALYSQLLDTLDIKDAETRKRDFAELVKESHEIRRYRNNLLHSTYIELKGGGDVVGLMRSNPAINANPDPEGPIFDQEMVSEPMILDKIGELGRLALMLNNHHLQLVHWAPFDQLRKPLTKS